MPLRRPFPWPLRILPRLGLHALLALAPALCSAQQAAASASPDTPAYATGDTWVDRQLADIDAYARRYPDSFLDELARSENLSVNQAQNQAGRDEISR